MGDIIDGYDELGFEIYVPAIDKFKIILEANKDYFTCEENQIDPQSFTNELPVNKYYKCTAQEDV